MKIMKRLLCLISSIIIAFTALTGTSLCDTSDISIDEMASTLNKLNILQGSNGSFFLDQKVDRAQATALIIRMLGKEKYVKENAEELMYTNYTDVAPTAWYAPYVGYGTKSDIIVGQPDGTFAPSEYITEKAFLKMALCALGYEYITDFDWTNVYAKAFEVGIVTDLSYSTKTSDNSNYLRSDAVAVIYRSLNTFKKGTETKMAFNLIDEEIFTHDELIRSGIFGKDEPTEIKKIDVLGPNKINIELNEDIKDLSIDDIKIYEADNENNILDVVSFDFENNYIQIVTEGQLPDEEYVIEINNIVDLIGNITGGLTGKFSGYETEEIKSNFFRISKVDQISPSIIHVYFTHPVNANSESPKYYELLKDDQVYVSGSAQNMTVKKLQSTDNAVSISLISKGLEQGSVYTLRVSGKMPSAYGVVLGDGNGDSRDFTAIMSQPKQLEVQSVQAWTSDSIRILFNREVDPVWAGKKLNYTVYDPDGDELTVTRAVVSTSGDFSGREVFVSLSYSFSKGFKYNLEIAYVPDIYKQTTIENKKIQFSGTYPTNKVLSLDKATSQYNNCVLLTFNMALDSATAQEAQRYLIRGDNTSYSASPIKAYYSEQGGNYTVKLYLKADDSLIKSKRYEVVVSNIKDALGNTVNYMTKTFTGGGENTDSWIKEAVTVSKDAVKLSFNVELAFDPDNMSSSNYSLSYDENGENVRIMPIGVTYVDARTLVLRFEELDMSKKYVLDFDLITDYSGQYKRSSSDEKARIQVKWGE
jgi:hypothetical protein